MSEQKKPYKVYGPEIEDGKTYVYSVFENYDGSLYDLMWASAEEAYNHAVEDRMWYEDTKSLYIHRFEMV